MPTFGDILSNLIVGAGKSIRRKPDDTGFEAYTPGSGGGITLEEVYPIDTIYISSSPVNPGTLFGMGTWIAIGTGRVLVGIDPSDPDFDTVGKTGGAKKIPSSAQSFAGTPSTVVVNHVHVQKLPSSQTGSQISGTRDASTTGSINDALSTNNPTGGSPSYTPAGVNTSGEATSVIQPYLVVYMWKRTAQEMK